MTRRKPGAPASGEAIGELLITLVTVDLGVNEPLRSGLMTVIVQLINKNVSKERLPDA